LSHREVTADRNTVHAIVGSKEQIAKVTGKIIRGAPEQKYHRTAIRRRRISFSERRLGKSVQCCPPKSRIFGKILRTILPNDKCEILNDKFSIQAQRFACGSAALRLSDFALVRQGPGVGVLSFKPVLHSPFFILHFPSAVQLPCLRFAPPGVLLVHYGTIKLPMCLIPEAFQNP
jgi:hypothetical protein